MLLADLGKWRRLQFDCRRMVFAQDHLLHSIGHPQLATACGFRKF